MYCGICPNLDVIFRPRDSRLQFSLAHNHLIVGKLPRELWASENRGLRTSISMGFLGMFRTEGFWANSSSY